ncbi:MAG: hypothetical protein K2M54_06240, partial [Muribaculaceae bacterium]|nr:hypothetical protein [Muribaculaceae bacterium]
MQHLIKSLAMGASVLMLASCAGGGSGEDEKIIDRTDFKSASGIFDIDALEALGRVTEPVASPDGSKILFGISYESVEENTSNRDLYV